MCIRDSSQSVGTAVKGNVDASIVVVINNNDAGDVIIIVTCHALVPSRPTSVSLPIP